jgi:hypothetical protein
MKKKPPISVVDLRDYSRCFLCAQPIATVSKIVILHKKKGQVLRFVCARTACAKRSPDYIHAWYAERPIHWDWIRDSQPKLQINPPEP